MESSQSRDQTCIPRLGRQILFTVPPGKPQRDIFASSLGGKKPLPKYLRTVLLENLGGTTIKQIEAPTSKVYWTEEEDWAPQRRMELLGGGLCNGPEENTAYSVGQNTEREAMKRTCQFYPRQITWETTAMGDCSQNEFQILRVTLQKKINKFIPYTSIPPPSRYPHFYEVASIVNTY